MKDSDILSIVGRSEPLFDADVSRCEDDLGRLISESSFLVIGGAGSIGQAVCTEIFKRDPRVLHVVDLSENNLVELVRGLRSSVGYKGGEFETFAIDSAGPEFSALVGSRGAPYDFVFNLSALKPLNQFKPGFAIRPFQGCYHLNCIHLSVSLATKAVVSRNASGTFLPLPTFTSTRRWARRIVLSWAPSGVTRCSIGVRTCLTR